MTTKLMARLAFHPDSDPDAAAEELSKAGYTVHRMPDGDLRRYHPLDDHIEAVIAGSADDKLAEFSFSHLLLAAALSAGGHQDEARTVASRALVLQPGFSTCAFCAALAIPASLATPLSKALRNAGLPD